ncbi:hypothetical protein MANES_08G081422v8 [Manihot esculenta]|uniref:Uncharacterized protein n=1 Tax=Manihot esculenta TaxID=3983 RepID=A0ACB7HBI0_MANES|nr:hypothetical protein MANES_08G081422v8 [Manihot esculenta]
MDRSNRYAALEINEPAPVEPMRLSPSNTIDKGSSRAGLSFSGPQTKRSASKNPVRPDAGDTGTDITSTPTNTSLVSNKVATVPKPRRAAEETKHVLVFGGKKYASVSRIVTNRGVFSKHDNTHANGNLDIPNVENQFSHPSAPNIDENLETNEIQEMDIISETPLERVISWNCQGATSPTCRRAFLEYKRLFKPDIFCIMEPRVSGTHADAICGRLGFDNWIRVESLGFSGGIWIFWTENNFSIQLIESHPQFFACKVLPVSGVSWNFCFIYASPYSPCRRILWTDLKLDSVDLSDEWMALGDFNCVPFQSELQGYNTFNISGAKLFSDWIFDNGLLDMGFEGSAFTWSRGLSSHSLQRARLDRALCSPNWQFRFPHAYVTHPAKFHSDHCPLVVSLNRHVHRMEGPFRFQLAWMNHADLGMIVGNALNSSTDIPDFI